MFRRGFKSWCERTAVSLRTQRGLLPSAPLAALVLGEELAVEILAPGDLQALQPDCVRRLLEDHSECWSAITIPSAGKPLIVYNPAHSPARQNSDLMHELSHILLNHEPGMTFVDPNSGLAVRAHDKPQEDEASWLAGCLLLPRDALLKIKRVNWTQQQACETYLVSLQMLTYRMNTSGVNIQHKRSRT
jgi:IrrE N-terminal-like domain